MSIPFEKARRTYLGFLQARGKALNTIKNYSYDLESLKNFCTENSLDFQNLGLSDLEAFHFHLKGLGLKTNSRRRRLITAKSFLRYLSGRSDVSMVGSEKLVPPEKVEKPPKLFPREKVLEIADEQPLTELGWRNRALVYVLLETGMLVTEALALGQEDCTLSNNDGATLRVLGKRPRMVKVSPSTAIALSQLKTWLGGTKYFFYGYSRGGRNVERLTPRGVELLFKGWSKKHGLKKFHPRTLRHLFVVDLMQKGKTQKEIMDHLGLRTPYAFRVYNSLHKSLSERAEHARQKRL